LKNNNNILKKQKINILREELNNSILEDKDYSIIYDLSVKLDELIADYYRNADSIEDVKFG